MAWKVAPSYEHMTIAEVDESTHKALVVARCDRCSGTGAYIIPGIFQGTCFKCNGAGKISTWVKAYTEAEYDTYVKAQTKAKEKRIQERINKQTELENKSEENKREFLNSLGFEADPYIYVVLGNTYKVKDELKERGGRYNPTLGWHFTHPTQLPDGYETVKIAFDELYSWNPYTKKANFKDDAKETVDAMRYQNVHSESEFEGEIKERLRSIKVTLTGRREIQSEWGECTLYTFQHDKNTLVWFSSASKTIPTEVGDSYLLTGTVKDHKIRDGVKQTILSRCVLKEVG